MNKKENLLKMLQGKHHEWIPISFFHHFPFDETAGQACIDAHIRFFQETDFDWIKIMHDGLEAPCSLHMNSIEELKEYRSKKGENAYVKTYLERAYGVNTKIGDFLYTYCNIFTPFTLLRRIGDDKLKIWTKEHRQIVKDALCWMAEDIAYLCEKMITDAGCLGIFLAMQGAESGLMPEEDFMELLDPCDRMIAERAAAVSDYNILHFCGWNEIPNQLQYWKDYPGNTVNWDTHVDHLSLAEGQKYFGNRPVLGGFDNRRNGTLYRGSQKEVEEETNRILREYVKQIGNTDRLMIGGDCSYLRDFERKRFQWVVDAVRAFEKEWKNGEGIICEN